MSKLKVGYFINYRSCNSSFINDLLDELNPLVTLYNVAELLKEDHHLMKDLDYFVIFGGDGTFIHTIIECMHDGFKGKFICLNSGNLGFHSSLELEDSRKLVTYFKDKSLVHTKVFKNYIFKYNDKDGYFINDILVNTGEVLKFDITVDGTKFENVATSGICLSTVFGSSGFNYSLNGSIIVSDKPLLSLKQVAPLRSVRHPSILPDTIFDLSYVNLKLRLNVNKLNDVNIYVDGVKMRDKDKIAEVEVKVAYAYEILKFAKDNDNDFNYNLKKLL